MRVYGSAEYLEKKMRDWSDDIFFLELWEDLQDRARANRDGKRKTVARDMSVEHVADKTSAVVGDEDAVGGALFDETAGHYRQLRVRAEDILLEQFLQNLREAIKRYGRVNPWSALSGGEAEVEDDNAQLAITAELDNTVQLLQSYLSFLANALARAPLRRIARQVTLSIQAFLWNHVLMRYTFSALGARQFERDVHGIWEVVDGYVGVRQGAMGMTRLREGLVLLRLNSDGALENGLEGGERKLNLADVNERLFRSNESGREVLEELGLELLSEGEARSILERRVDLNG